jgi:hypothetical protein
MKRGDVLKLGRVRIKVKDYRIVNAINEEDKVYIANLESRSRSFAKTAPSTSNSVLIPHSKAVDEV